jgi:uncharacterized protein (PEP-CTERM system associated)
MKIKPAVNVRALCVGTLWFAMFAGQVALAQDATVEMAAAGADVSAPKPSISVVPRVSLTETWTSNALLTTVPQADQITELSPGLRVDVNKARLKGFFDYAVTGDSYAQNSSPFRSTNALSSNFTLEAIDNFFFIDTNGSISQQAISAFGTQSVDAASVNPNSTQVASYSIAPRLQGRLGGFADYVARYSRSISNSSAATVATNTSSIGLKDGNNASTPMGWSVDANHQDVSYGDGRPTEDDTLMLGWHYAISPQLNVFVEGGEEASNYSSTDMQTNALTGFGLTWSPQEATKLSLNGRHHVYGDTFALNFDHRTGLTAWHYSNTRDVTQTPDQQGTASLGTAYDLYFAQFASLQPDPVARAQLVNAYLQTYGIPPGAAVTTGFSASSLSMQHQQQLSFALLGVRDTVTFMATQTDSNLFDGLTTAVDNFSTSSSISQRGLTMNLAHRLTPEYSLSAMVSELVSTGSVDSLSNTLRSLNLNLSGKLGSKTTVSLGLRRVVSDSALVPYSESALTCALSLQL